MSVKINKGDTVIFLDIDGVIHHQEKDLYEKMNLLHKTFPVKHFTEHTQLQRKTIVAKFLDKAATLQLHNLINEVKKLGNVHIVISSSWREGQTVEELKEIFQEYEFSNYISDKTVEPMTLSHEATLNNCEKSGEHPLDKIHQCRASEIKHWLKEHPDILNFVILDDQVEHIGATFSNNFVKVDRKTLMTEEITKKALQILQVGNSKCDFECYYM